MEVHTLEPVFDKNSKILILGSFPSIKSREVGFYYSHPQNRFWKVLSSIFHEKNPESINEKKQLLKKHHIALFDVCASCDISSSSDASIKNVVPNDLDEIFKTASIKAIFFDGKKAYLLYLKYLEDKYNVPLICLPSTSPANATWSLEKLTREYQTLFRYTK